MSKPLSNLKLLELTRLLNGLPEVQLGQLIYVIRPDSSMMPASSAAKGSRVEALLTWVESRNGCGFADFLTILSEIVPHDFAPEDFAPSETTIPQTQATDNQLHSTELSLRETQGEVKAYREMMEVLKTVSEKPMGDQHFHGPVGNVAQTNQGKMQAVQHNYAPEQQNLSEAAKEIQALLKTLSDTYNTNTDAGKEKLIQEVGEEVKKHPKWRRALKEGGIELVKVLCAPIGVPLEMARVYLGLAEKV